VTVCGGASYKADGQEIRTWFPNPKARLPVATKSGVPALVGWGRRESQSGQLPLGGWARLDSINAGKWKRFHPQPVKILVDAFMEKDDSGNSHWFTLPEKSFIQGLMAEKDEEHRLYVVTIDAPPEMEKIHKRWPRVMNVSGEELPGRAFL
jgi:hypothetical protein